MKIVDVREPAEFVDGHAAGALNVPLSAMDDGHYGGLTPDEPIALYCASGARAEIARQILQKAGFGSVANVRTRSAAEALFIT